MDETTFHKLATAEFDAVYRLAYHLCGSSNDADDLVQETYLRAFRFSASFSLAEHGIRPWLFKILHNVLMSRLSKDQRDHAALEHLQTLQASESVAAALPLSGWDTIDGRLRDALDELPVAHRASFLLWAIEGLKYREIADVTGVPIGTVMSRLSRARAMLAEKLRNAAPGHVSSFPDASRKRGRSDG